MNLQRLCFAVLISCVTSVIAISTPNLFALPHAVSGSEVVSRQASSESQGFASLTEAIRNAAYTIRPSSQVGELSAINSRQRMRVHFSSEGLALDVSRADEKSGGVTDSSDVYLRCRTTAIGYGDRLVPLSAGEVLSDGSLVGTAIDGEGTQCARIVHPEMVEYFVNRPEGLEHGYIISTAPEATGKGEAPLRIKMEWKGAQELKISSDQKSATLHNSKGGEVLCYGGLKVWDAMGQTLAARMAVDGSSLAIEVDDRDAIYPVTIDPTFSQQAYLKASNTGAGDEFGTAVAISGNTVVVGARHEKSLSTLINGDQSDDTGFYVGAAYVFVRQGTHWVQQAYLKAANAGESDRFGESVAISGDTIVIGARGESSSSTGVNGIASNNSAPISGAAYVFVRTGNTWTQQAYLKASNTDGGDQFGCSVAIHGNTAIIGAKRESSSSTIINGDQSDNSVAGAGAAYVFVRSGGTWTQQAYLKAPNSENDDEFGFSVAIHGDTAVIGAYQEDSAAIGVNGNWADNSASNAGAAYVFVRSGLVWSRQAYVKALSPGENDLFGHSVAVFGDTIVVGANGEASLTNTINGDPYDNSAPYTGAAYVFTRTSGIWSQKAYLKASNAEGGDQFGNSVSIDGDLIVVGARYEDGSSTGVNGDSSKNDSWNAGAAYVFFYATGTWSQIAYLKASNSGTSDQFGFATAVAGRTVLIGANTEDSSAQGVNGDGANDASSDSGAVYVFYLPTVGRAVVKKQKAFPTTTISKKSKSRLIPISNVGDLPINNVRVITTGTARSEFLITQPSGKTINGGSVKYTRVTFRPKKKGIRRAVLEVRSTAPTVKVALSGKGLPKPPAKKKKK